VLVLGELAADHHEPAPAGDHVAVAAPRGHPLRSYNVLEHGQHLLLVHDFNDVTDFIDFTGFSGARAVTRPTGIIPEASSEFPAT
jgi:hypothetical protein